MALFRLVSIYVVFCITTLIIIIIVGNTTIIILFLLLFIIIIIMIMMIMMIIGVVHNSDPSLLTHWIKLIGDYIALLNSHQVRF